nr:putative inactive leucine-rich repeat receptor-like protein kinase [Quercus suber]
MNFQDPFPFDIAELLQYVTSLDLSANKFSGEIPKSIGNCSYLNVLKLDNNQLIAESFANNKKLCGGPLEPCPKRGLRFFSFKSGFLVGYAASAVTVMAILMCRYVGCMNGKQSNKKMRRSNKNKKADQVNRLQIKGLAQEGIRKNSQLEGNVTRMNFTKLSEASNNFSTDNAIGLGKIGVMYKAKLPNGSLLAVKRISNFGGAKISTFEGAMVMDSNETDSSNSSFVDNGVWELGFVKKDVYDFGLLLLELIIGKELNQINNYPNSLSESLVDWITHLLTSPSNVYSVIDKSLIGQGFDGEIFQFLRIACTCFKPFPVQRPTMLELYNTISLLGERYGITNG